ncbi:hypothetical protein [Agromyces bauzanensis]|nr:hypothetical protein [Agromyces bauzanensis]
MLLNRRQLMISAAAVVGGGMLAQGATIPASAMVSTIRTDAWGVTLRGAWTDTSSIAIPSSFDAARAANARSWVRQQVRIAKALAEVDEEYTFVYFWERSLEEKPLTASARVDSPAGRALYGESFAADDAQLRAKAGTYRWESAGVVGRIVHETGLDTAN